MSDTMTSPIAFLDRQVLHSMHNVAPEKAQELERVFKEHNVSFEIRADDTRQGFSADLTNKVIIVRHPRLERLWAIAFGYYRFYREVSQQKLPDESLREIDLTRTPELREAGLLLKWAVDSLTAPPLGNRLPTWPDGLPRPTENDEKHSDENCATELFLAAAGYVLHHELAHIRLGHRSYDELESADAIQQEKEADYAAADWLLDGFDDEFDQRFQKRALGVCLGLISLASLYLHVYVGRVESDTHPPVYDRLYQVVGRHVHDPDNLPWAFVATALVLHLQNQQIEYEHEREFRSFREAADYYIDVISRMYL